MPDESKYRLYSLGVVAEPKKLNDREILVVPIEIVPFIDGEIKSNPLDIKDEGKDKNGKPYSVQVTADNTVTAEWMANGNDNRDTPPDVRRGERVLIYRYDQNDKFYWVSLGDIGLRRLETVVFRFSGHTDENSVTLTDDNSYWFEVSTHKGSITLQTSKKNNEKVIYGMQFNPKEGTFTLKDDIGNYLFLDSTKAFIELENKDKSLLRLDQKTALLQTVESITLETKNIKVNGTETVAVTTKEHTVKANNSTFTIASKMMVKAANMVIKAITAITGNTSISGNFGSSGGTFTHEGTDVGNQHQHIGTKPSIPTDLSGVPKP